MEDNFSLSLKMIWSYNTIAIMSHLLLNCPFTSSVCLSFLSCSFDCCRSKLVNGQIQQYSIYFKKAFSFRGKLANNLAIHIRLITIIIYFRRDITQRTCICIVHVCIVYSEDLNLFTTLHSLTRVRVYISVYARFLIRLLNKLIRVVLVFSKRDTAPFALRPTNQPNVTE